MMRTLEQTVREEAPTIREKDNASALPEIIAKIVANHGAADMRKEFDQARWLKIEIIATVRLHLAKLFSQVEGKAIIEPDPQAELAESLLVTQAGQRDLCDKLFFDAMVVQNSDNTKQKLLEWKSPAKPSPRDWFYIKLAAFTRFKIIAAGLEKIFEEEIAKAEEKEQKAAEKKKPTSRKKSNSFGLTDLALAAATVTLVFVGVKITQTKLVLDFSNSDSSSASAPEKTPQVAITDFEFVLSRGMRIFQEATRTFKDDILDPNQVTKYLLGGKFRYTGVENGGDVFRGRKERIHLFALIGEKSGHLLKKGGGKDLWRDTTLADALNILMDAGTFTDSHLAEYLVWAYQKSFNVDLGKPEYIRIVRKKNGSVKHVVFTPPESFERRFGIFTSKTMKEVPSNTPGGNSTLETEPQFILDEHDHLLLPSGISPIHDLRIPASMLRRKQRFNLSLREYGDWDVDASMIAEHIRIFEKKEQEARDHPERQFHDIPYGQKVTHYPMAHLVVRNNENLNILARFLVKNIPAGDHRGRITRLIEFVQSFPYARENNIDIDRPGIIVVFNGGSDCNNVTKLFVELMLALGYDCAVFYADDAKFDFASHILAGVPREFFSKRTSFSNDEEGTSFSNDEGREWSPIELTSKGHKPGEPVFKDRSAGMVYRLEEIFAKGPVSPGIKPGGRPQGE